jgi:hypothetical protein
MDFDIDIEKIADLKKRELYREAFARLESHEAEVMAEADIYISQEGKIGFLTKLRNSRMQDLANISALHNIDNDFGSGWFSDRIGIQAGAPFTRPLSILICELTIEWLRKKIEEIKAGDTQKAIAVSGHNNSETVLIFYFGMLALGYAPRKAESVANFARFLHALTGKPIKSLDNSDFYDKMKVAPVVTKDPKRLLQYLQNVRLVFEQSGFKEPLTAIDQEIEQVKQDIEEANTPKKRLK